MYSDSNTERWDILSVLNINAREQEYNYFFKCKNQLNQFDQSDSNIKGNAAV